MTRDGCLDVAEMKQGIQLLLICEYVRARNNRLINGHLVMHNTTMFICPLTSRCWFVITRFNSISWQHHSPPPRIRPPYRWMWLPCKSAWGYVYSREICFVNDYHMWHFYAFLVKFRSHRKNHTRTRIATLTTPESKTRQDYRHGGRVTRRVGEKSGVTRGWTLRYLAWLGAMQERVVRVFICDASPYLSGL